MYHSGAVHGMCLKLLNINEGPLFLFLIERFEICRERHCSKHMKTWSI